MQSKENENSEESNNLLRVTKPVSTYLSLLSRTSELLYDWDYSLFISGIGIAGVPNFVSCVTLCNLVYFL